MHVHFEYPLQMAHWSDIEVLPDKKIRPKDYKAIHGHNWRVEIDVTGDLDLRGIVVDETDIRKIIDKLDNTFLPYNPLVLSSLVDKTCAEDYAGSMEGVAILLVREVAKLGDFYVNVRVWETPHMYAEADSPTVQKLNFREIIK